MSGPRSAATERGAPSALSALLSQVFAASLVGNESTLSALAHRLVEALGDPLRAPLSAAELAVQGSSAGELADALGLLMGHGKIRMMDALHRALGTQLRALELEGALKLSTPPALEIADALILVSARFQDPALTPAAQWLRTMLTATQSLPVPHLMLVIRELQQSDHTRPDVTAEMAAQVRAALSARGVGEAMWEAVRASQGPGPTHGSGA